MIKRTIPAIVAVLAIALTAAPAQGAPSRHRLKLTIEDVTIHSQGDQPGAKQTTAGVVSGNPLGRAVESINDKVTTATSHRITFQGTMTIYTTHGTMTATIRITITPTSAGGATGTGHGNITTGTGTYNHAGGSFTFTGAERLHSPVFLVHAIGTATY